MTGTFKVVDGASPSGAGSDSVSASGLSALDRLEALLACSAEGGSWTAAADALAELRGVIEAVDRRESSIEMLHRTAADIISERHVDEVIAAAVDRAHKLLVCDLAYLALYDPKTRETYVKAASGSTSSHFTELRVPFGLGVGGVVARSLAPFETADYLNDKRFGHIAGVDRGIADEKIRAMAGAPMLVGQEFVGAIFAANRTVRNFTSEELKQLATLGAFVGLALSNARMLEAREQALAEAQNAYSVLQRRNDAIAQIAKLHEKMLEAITGGSHVGLVADIVSASLGLTVSFIPGEAEAGISDRFSQPGIATADVERAYRAAMEISARNGSCQRLDLPGTPECFVVAVGNGETNYGALAAITDVPLTGTHQRSLERAALTCALLLGRARDNLLHVSRGWSRAFQQFMQDTTDPVGPDYGLFETFFSPDDAILVMCFRPQTRVFDKVFFRCTTTAQAMKGFVAEYAGRIYMLLSDTADPEAIRNRIAPATGADINIGLASARTGYAGIRGAVVDALRAQTFLDQRKYKGTTARFADLGQLIVLMQGKSDGELAGMVKAALEPVLSYDARNATALLQTLEVYFDVGNNASEAAQQLGVHPKTLVQRLDRLTTLLGDGWKLGARGLDLRVALRIHSHLEASRSASLASLATEVD